jgi:hypothetical protein
LLGGLGMDDPNQAVPIKPQFDLRDQRNVIRTPDGRGGLT